MTIQEELVIYKHNHHYSTKKMCELMRLSKQGYYNLFASNHWGYKSIWAVSQLLHYKPIDVEIRLSEQLTKQLIKERKTNNEN